MGGRDDVVEERTFGSRDLVAHTRALQCRQQHLAVQRVGQWVEEGGAVGLPCSQLCQLGAAEIFQIAEAKEDRRSDLLRPFFPPERFEPLPAQAGRQI